MTAILQRFICAECGKDATWTSSDGPVCGGQLCATIKILRAEIAQLRDRERMWLLKMRRDTIEECAQEAELYNDLSGLKIAMKIRALLG